MYGKEIYNMVFNIWVKIQKFNQNKIKIKK